MKRERRAGGGISGRTTQSSATRLSVQPFTGGKYRPWQRLGGDGAAQTQDEIMNVPNKSEWTGEKSQEKRAG